MVLSFSEEDTWGVVMPHVDILVVTLTAANHVIHRILVNNGSSAKILYLPDFKQMGIDRDRFKPFGSPLIGFDGEKVQPIGLISLLVVDQPSAYNAIIGQPALNKWRAITSIYHLMMKFPIDEGVGEVKGDQIVARRCYNTFMKKASNSTALTVGIVTKAKGKPVESLEDMTIEERKVLKIGTCLTPDVRDSLITFLQQNLEVFT
jgi:hypothetical protein